MEIVDTSDLDDINRVMRDMAELNLELPFYAIVKALHDSVITDECREKILFSLKVEMATFEAGGASYEYQAFNG